MMLKEKILNIFIALLLFTKLIDFQNNQNVSTLILFVAEKLESGFLKHLFLLLNTTFLKHLVQKNLNNYSKL